MRQARRLLTLVGFISLLIACNEKGACMMHVTGVKDETCVEVKKSVCDEGKDRWVGGKCPAEAPAK